VLGGCKNGPDSDGTLFCRVLELQRARTPGSFEPLEMNSLVERTAFVLLHGGRTKYKGDAIALARRIRRGGKFY